MEAIQKKYIDERNRKIAVQQDIRLFIKFALGLTELGLKLKKI